MAEERDGALGRCSRMRTTPVISDTILDNSDQDEEEKTLDPDHLEERFPVDRRKLEQMIQAHCDLDEHGTAEDFFHKIMEDTNTRITWPSKLKIGAKSKKDPHIKVSGHKDAVADAKDKIMAVLDKKSSRVTLKMDVSHTEHSHVIGKGGNNIKQVMQETGCHIHFPDSNRNTQAEKSNQVSIAGQPKGVEQARGKIRELLPLVFMFDLPVAGLLQPLPDISSPQIQQIQNMYGVSISFKQRTRMYLTTVVIRGSVCNAKSVKEATVVLIEHLTGNIGTTIPVSMQLEIAPQHHLFIIGRGGANIKQIMQHTGATIHFPDPNNSSPQGKGTVFITGAISSVFMARQQLIGCLPLVLMFDMKEDTEIDQAKISQLMEQLDVYISIKPKPKQPSKSVIVKSIERNTSNLYEARRRLLGLINEAAGSALIPAGPGNHGSNNTTTNRNISTLSLLGHSQLFVVNGTRSMTSPHITSPTLVNAPTVYHPMMVLAPPSGYTNLPSATYTVYSQNGLQKDSPVLLGPNGLTKDIVQPCASPKATLKPAPQQEPAGSSETSTGSLTMTAARAPVSESPDNTDCHSREELRHNHNSNKGSPVNLGSPVLDHRSITSQPGTISHDSIVTSREANTANTLDLLSNVMSISMLGSQDSLNSITTSIGNLPFTKSDLQDAVSSIQSKPNLLEQLLPSVERPTEEGGFNVDLFSNPQPDRGPVSRGFTHLPPSGSVLNGGSTKRVKTPPGFSSHPRAHKEGSPLRQFTSHFDTSQSLFENNLVSSQHSSLPPNPNSPLGLGSSSPLSLSSSSIRRGQDSPLGCLGSPLASGGSPLRGNGSPLNAPASPICRSHPRFFQNGDAKSSESGCDSDGSDCRAPGSNRPMKLSPQPPPLFSPTSSMFASFDYEQKKLMATKAMQKKPEGESRIPTDFWSGLGFSKSMPDSAIRERLKSCNIRYNGPSMTTTYESVNDEVESDPWGESQSIAEEAESPSLDHLPSHISAAPGEFPSPRKKLGDYMMREHDEGGVVSVSPDWPPKTDLAELLCKMGLGKYTDLFTQQEIDLSTFLTLSDQDLKELGISTFGARRKMLIAISDLNKRQTLMTTHPVGGNSNPFQDTGSTLMHSSRRHDIASQSGRW